MTTPKNIKTIFRQLEEEIAKIEKERFCFWVLKLLILKGLRSYTYVYTCVHNFENCKKLCKVKPVSSS